MFEFEYTMRGRFFGYFKQSIVHFDNGYGVSVVNHDKSYGGKEGLYELAVLRGDDICYDTPITNDVIGWLTIKEAEAIAERVKALSC